MKHILIILLILTLLILTGCTSNNDTISTLEKAGYTNINVGEWDAFGCSDDDFYSTRFTATNSLNNTVEGTVCCGLMMKRCTIRY